MAWRQTDWSGGWGGTLKGSLIERARAVGPSCGQPADVTHLCHSPRPQGTCCVWAAVTAFLGQRDLVGDWKSNLCHPLCKADTGKNSSFSCKLLVLALHVGIWPPALLFVCSLAFWQGEEVSARRRKSYREPWVYTAEPCIAGCHQYSPCGRCCHCNSNREGGKRRINPSNDRATCNFRSIS